MTYATQLLVQISDKKNITIKEITTDMDITVSRLGEHNQTARFLMSGKSPKTFPLSANSKIYACIASANTRIVGGAIDDIEIETPEFTPSTGKSYRTSIETEEVGFFKDLSLGKYTCSDDGYWHHADTGELIAHDAEAKQTYEVVSQLLQIFSGIDISE